MESFCISPHLYSLPITAFPFAFGGVEDPRIRKELKSKCRTHFCVFDSSAALFHMLSREEYRFLCDRCGKEFTRPPGDTIERNVFDRLREVDLVVGTTHSHCKLRHVDIEINSHCNLRCAYCPVASDPHPKQYMDKELFGIVLSRVAEEEDVASIDLNHYGEPTLHPELVDFARLAKEHHLEVQLYTNATRLDANVADSLATLGNVAIYINLPTTDPDDYRRITGGNTVERIIENVSRAVQAGLPCRLYVNLPRKTRLLQKRRIARKLRKATSADISFLTMSNRAGSMKNETYAALNDNGPRLGGCFRASSKVSVGVDGKVFLCCQDYKKEYVLGNIREQSLRDIMNGPRALDIQRKLSGLDPAPEGFICRKCDYTRPLDGQLWVGRIPFAADYDSLLTRFKASVVLRRIGSRFPWKVGELQPNRPCEFNTPTGSNSTARRETPG